LEECRIITQVCSLAHIRRGKRVASYDDLVEKRKTLLSAPLLIEVSFFSK